MSPRFLSLYCESQVSHVYTVNQERKEMKEEVYRPGQTRPDWIKPDQTRPNWTRPGQTRLDQTRLDRTKPNQKQKLKLKQKTKTHMVNILVPHISELLSLDE